MSNVLELTNENFTEQVLNADTPVLVDFWAPWCGPCRMVGPVIEELATDFLGKVKVGKVNVDEQPDLAAKYRIMTIPTVGLFKAGAMEDKRIGAYPKEEFSNMIQKNM